MKKHLFILLLFSSNQFFSQSNCIDCNFKFHITLNKGETLPLYSDSLEKTIYKNPYIYDSIDLYVTVDRYKSDLMRIKSVNALIYYVNEEMNSLDAFSYKEMSNKWVSTNKLETALTEWTFDRDLNAPSLFIFNSPTLAAEKEKLPAYKWYKEVNNSTIYNYSIVILECKGQWVKINLKSPNRTYTGWMPWYNLCHRTLSLCHHIPEDGVKKE